MRLERIVPGTAPRNDLDGAVLVRDLVVDGDRWSKGRRLTAADLHALAGATDVRRIGKHRPGAGIPVLIVEPGELHEDEAGVRLAQAVSAGDPGLVLRGPNESRVDLVAAADGVVAIRIGALERLNAIDPLEVFTVFDGQIVRTGDIVASVKVGPHVVPASTVERGMALAGRGGPLVRLRPFTQRNVAVLVKESVTGQARERFETSVRTKVEGLGSTMTSIQYVADESGAVIEALRPLTRGPGRADLILTAGGASTDPDDPFYVAVRALRGRVERRGVPAHPGSMVWLGRVGRTTIVGLPTCGAYSKATAADLLLPRLLVGEPATAATVAKLGHGGILTRSMRFRFPAYARDLDAPDG